ncbi:hypothetical protein [Streptomyces sp. NPDC050287]
MTAVQAFSAPGRAALGEEAHQAEGEEQQEQQAPHRASPCPAL